MFSEDYRVRLLRPNYRKSAYDSRRRCRVRSVCSLMITRIRTYDLTHVDKNTQQSISISIGGYLSSFFHLSGAPPFDHPVGLLTIPRKSDSPCDLVSEAIEPNEAKKRNPVTKRHPPDRVRARKRCRDRESASIMMEHVDTEKALPKCRTRPRDRENLVQTSDKDSDREIAQHHAKVLIHSIARQQAHNGAP